MALKNWFRFKKGKKPESPKPEVVSAPNIEAKPKRKENVRLTEDQLTELLEQPKKRFRDSLKNIKFKREKKSKPPKSEKPEPKVGGGSTEKILASFLGSFSKARGGGSLWWVFLAVLLYISDLFITGFNGFSFTSFLNTFSRISFESIGGIFLNVGVISVFIGYLVFKKPDVREAVSFFIFVELIWLIITMGGLPNLGVVLHLAFAIVVLIFLLYPAMEDKIQANFLIGICLFIDFFLFSIIAESGILPYFNRLIIPVWFFLTLAFVKESKIKSVLVFVIIMFYVLNSYSVVAEFNRVGMESLTQEDKTRALKYVQEVWKNLKSSTVSFAEKQANATLGEYYTGEIDRKAKERLGVYIEDLQAADTTFYEDQPVNVWATLVAQTIDEPIDVEISCTVDGEIIEGVEIYPKEIFEVESFEEEGIECSFEPGLLKEGYHEISLNSKFNFLTMAYIKTYFMDPERKRSLIGEGIDPLENYGIMDKDPRAVYTSGPIMIGLDIGKPPLSTDKEFRLGMTLTNWWGGKIDKITDLYIITPNEIELERGEGGMYSCRGKRNYVFESSSCSEIGEEEKGCDDRIYNIFKIDSSANEIKDIENYETILCRLNIQDQEGLLGGVPLATKYFKVVAKYDYNIHEEIGVEVKGGDGVRTVLADGECAKKCIDDDGCLCPDGCEIPKGQHIYKDMTCGGEKQEGGKVFAESGCSGDWRIACGTVDSPLCINEQDGIFCVGTVWTCTTNANNESPTYHDKRGCFS